MNQEERMARENAGYQEVADDLYSEPGDILSPEQARLLNEELTTGRLGLYRKLFKLQGIVGKISKDLKNPFFKSKYFDINKLLDHLIPHLQECGLFIIQPIRDGIVVSKVVDVDTGEFIESNILLPANTDPQKMGMAVSYYRRYTLTSLLSLQSEDDDGNSVSTQGRSGVNNSKPNAPEKKEDDDDKKWLNATNKEGKLTKNGEYTAQKLYSGETTWDEIWKSVKVSKKDRAAVDKRVSEFDKDIDMDGSPF